MFNINFSTNNNFLKNHNINEINGCYYYSSVNERVKKNIIVTLLL